MKAWILRSPSPVDDRPLELVELDVPEPGSGEVRIKVVACGVCRTDIHVAEADLAPKISPVVLGHQIVGTVDLLGDDVRDLELGQRVGVAWLYSTCGRCRFCLSGRENLCDLAEFTGWTRNGGFAEYAVANTRFVYPLPVGFPDVQAAPLLCAGIIGYRALRLTGITDWAGARLGIYGFGAAGHVCIQVARNRGASVFVCTRDREKHQALAQELGAVWVGDTLAVPPVKLDAAIIFAPAGEIVPTALDALDKGGTLVLGGIHMSPIPGFDYDLIYGERMIRSVANNTREDGREFLVEAGTIPIRTTVQTFKLEEASEALIALKNDAIKGAAIVVI